MLNSRPNIDAELGLITLRLQKQELEQVFSLFNFENLKLINFERKFVCQLSLNLYQGSDVDPGLRDGAGSFKMVNFEVEVQVF